MSARVIFLIALVFSVAFWRRKDIVNVISHTQRGLRNNNPGNIRHGAQWQGMSPTQTDESFVTFISPEYGIRAIARVLMNYVNLYGLDTVRKIVSRWAPSVENDTESYVSAVAAALGVNPDTKINVIASLPRLIPAIIKHENGLQPYPPDVISKGISLS